MGKASTAAWKAPPEGALEDLSDDRFVEGSHDPSDETDNESQKIVWLRL
jgi:hypothetical protein